MKRAYVTMLSRPSYLPGTLVLHHSLQAVKSKYPLICAVTSTLPKECRDILQKFGIETKEIEYLRLSPERYDQSKTHPRFEDNWTKLRIFEFEEYEKLVYLDSDMLICKNIDDLFELPIGENQIAASHACTCNPHFPPHPKDWYPEYCSFARPDYPNHIKYPEAELTGPTNRTYKFLNGGFFVFRPSSALLGRMLRMLNTTPIIRSWRFCEQDLLTAFFGGGGERPEDWGIEKEELGDLWMGVPYHYNGLITMRNTHPKLWKDDEVKVIHYIRTPKPWKLDPSNEENKEDKKLDMWWWDSYKRLIQIMKSDGRDDEVAYIDTLVGSDQQTDCPKHLDA